MKHYRIFNKKYHNESSALERSVINNCGGVVEDELKLALRDPNPRPQLRYW